MNFIAEFDISTSIFRETRETLPGLVTEIEDVQLRSNRQPQLVCWVQTDDYGAFEAALPNDSTVEEFEVLADGTDRRLYRITLSERGASSLTYPVAVEHDVTYLEVRGTDRGTRISARIPTRERFGAFRTALERRQIPFRLHRIFQADTTAEPQYGVTDRQREVLLFAFEAGYFDVPRRVSLSEIAREFDVSDQALSALLRRGEANLIRHSLASQVDTKSVE
jgi:hypothetical protein